jgi:general secretion pathway protein E
LDLHSGYDEAVEGVIERQNVDWELCSHGVFSEADLLDVYAEVTELPVLDIDELGDIEKFESLPVTYLSSLSIIPLRWDEKRLEMLICDPYSVRTIFYMFKEIYNKQVSFRLAKRSTIEHLINEVYQSGDEEDEVDMAGLGDSEEALRTLACEAKIVRLVNEMFSRAAELEASDIHVEPEEDRMVIRFRIDGMLQEILTTPLSQFPAVASRIKLVGGLNIAEHRLPQDGRTNLKIGRSDMDVRISTIPTMHGESIVLRILRKDTMEFSLGSVGMAGEMQQDFSSLAHLPHGIILVVGPTGSGKTTTLYSVMNMLNTRDRKIITIEDPVEYKMSGLSQMQVNHKIGLDFASGLRNIVRQDPDVILVGEIRDRETADIAINAALTGHLVLSTLHTNDAAGAVSRLQDMGVEGFLISSALAGVLSQRLVRKICDSCSGEGTVDGVKCKRCNGSGMRGRTAIFELLMMNDELRGAVNDNLDSAVISEIAQRNGMVPILECGQTLVDQGVTTESELARAVAAH